MTSSASIGQMRAVLRIQWLSMKNSLRSRSQRVGLILSAVAAIVWYGLWAAGAAGLFALSFWVRGPQLERALPAILFFILMYWQLSPLLTASMGVSIDLRKMALFPIGVGSLFVVECLLRLINGLEMLLLLAGLTLGMAARAPRAIPVFAPAVALFVLFNMLLSAGLRNLLERLLQRRRFREIFLFAIVMASATPQLILWSGSGRRVSHHIYAVFQFLPQSFLPSTALAHAYLGRSGGADWAVMAGACALAAAFGFWQFRRSFRFDFAAARAATLGSQPERETWTDRLYQLPARLLPDPAAALIEKELRYLSRSARFRFLFLMGCSFGVVAWLPFGMRRGASGG
ncbi:MAG TPA: hypothetical protein VEU62_18140, partial [Bryobacterales bacterium]|nr:hypothetical protein [Bryobacterales bacterium]